MERTGVSPFCDDWMNTKTELEHNETTVHIADFRIPRAERQIIRAAQRRCGFRFEPDLFRPFLGDSRGGEEQFDACGGQFQHDAAVRSDRVRSERVQRLLLQTHRRGNALRKLVEHADHAQILHQLRYVRLGKRRSDLLLQLMQREGGLQRAFQRRGLRQHAVSQRGRLLGPRGMVQNPNAEERKRQRERGMPTTHQLR